MVRKEKNKGITLITLVIMIIVLLILASITISSITGDNGIIKRAIQAKDVTEETQIIEQVELQVIETIAEEGKFDSEKFKENVEENLKEYNPKITEDEDTITVTIDDTEVTVDKETGEIIGTTPKAEINIYDKEGNPIDIKNPNNEKEVVITIDITNKEELDGYEITVKDEEGKTIEKDETVTGTGDESYTVPGEGEYTITITGTKEGKEETIEKVITIGNNEEEIETEISFTPNGGSYIMPTTGKATISTRIEANSTSGKEYTYYYAWGEDNTTEPTEWTPTTSSEKISKTDCIEGSYYLWIKTEGESQEKVTVSNEFKVNSNSNQNSQIILTPNKTEPTNGDITVTVTYGDILTEERTLECTGEEGIDYVREGTDKIIVKTNGQTVTATAKDEAGNIVTKSYTVNNIDKIEPSTTAPTATATTNSVTVNFAQTDNGSGVNSSTIQYSIKKTTESEWGEWITDSNTSHTFTGLELGTSYDVRTQVKDKAGNGYTISETYTITTTDITKPTIKVPSTEWTNQDITVTIEYPEIEGITKQYSYDNSTWETYTEPLIIESNKTIYARSIDSTNQGADSSRVASAKIENIDKTMPTMEVNSNETASKTQTATITIKDTESGLEEGTYTIKYTWTTNILEPNWEEIQTTKTIQVIGGGKTATTTVEKTEGTGTYYIHVKIENLKDQAENTNTTVAYGIFKLTNEGPTINFGTNGNTTYKKEQSTTITIEAEEGTTIDENNLKYQWTQTTTQPEENTFTEKFSNGETIKKNTGTGKWYLWIIAKDTLGNTTIKQSNAFYLDNTAPSKTAPTATATTNTITASFAQTDGESGISSSTKQYAIKKTTESSWGEWITDENTSHTFTGLTLNTSYDVRTQVKDTAGNGYTISEIYTIKTVDITKPVIKVLNTNWTNQDITVTIEYPEIEGLTKQYSYDNNIWQTYTGPLTIDSNKTIYARSKDSTNQGTDSTRTSTVEITNIDKTPPQITNLTATTDTITVTATDEQSGIIKYTSTTTDIEPLNYTTVENTKTLNATINYLNMGTKYYVWVKDSAGNIAKKEITTEKKDIIKGFVDDIGTSSVIYLYGNSEQVNSGEITITMPDKTTETITATNDNTVIDATNTITGSGTKYCATYTATKNGKYTFTVTSGTSTIEQEIEVKNIEKFTPIENVGTASGTNAYTYKGAVVPKGYYVDTNTNVETGLVITDGIDSEGYATGNEWVWVPVNSTIDNNDYYIEETGTYYYAPSIIYNRYSKLYSFSEPKTRDPYGKMCTNSDGDTLDIEKPSSENCRYVEPAVYEDDEYNLANKRGTTEKITSLENLATQYINDFDNMTKSVDKYGGFYIGRYELSGTETQGKVKRDNVEASSYYTAYNSCMNFDNKYVTGSMIYGTLWDATMQWLLKSGYSVGYNSEDTYGNYLDKEIKLTKENTTIVVKPSGKEIKLKTGETSYTKTNNIYDLAGNASEITQERNKAGVIGRSGVYTTPYIYSMASRVIMITISTPYDDRSSRACLYIK